MYLLLSNDNICNIRSDYYIYSLYSIYRNISSYCILLVVYHFTVTYVKHILYSVRKLLKIKCVKIIAFIYYLFIFIIININRYLLLGNNIK